MPRVLRFLAAGFIVLVQLTLLGRGACPIPDESASRTHAHHGTAPAPASESPAETPHDDSGCYMTSACGAGAIHEAATVLAMDDVPHEEIVAFDAFARVLAAPSPEPPPPRA